MKGYCLLDLDGALSSRTKESIDVNDPYFWQRNEYEISQVWQFDTDDIDGMYMLFRRFKELQLKSSEVINFSKMIDFNIERIKTYARSLQSNQGSDFSSP